MCVSMYFFRPAKPDAFCIGDLRTRVATKRFYKGKISGSKNPLLLFGGNPGN